VTLEAKLQEAAKRGELSYVSLLPVAVGRGKSETHFAACFRNAKTGTLSTVTNADPAKALLLALKGTT
jgi:D-alanyl-D-alanine carboxypeptidase